MLKYISALCVLLSLFCSDVSAAEIIPIEHASFVIKGDDLTVMVDPVGDVSHYVPFRMVDVILITHEHADHLDADLVRLLRRPYTVILGPESVIDKLGFGYVLKNGENRKTKGITVTAVPAYNTTAERLEYHPQGRDNGYVLDIQGERIYVSGDTEDIPEMRSLTGIDKAFVCMNLPYTMTVQQAASAVLEFKPHTVYPYHYRGQDGFSDLDKFKKLVSKDNDIKVEVLKWY